MIKDNDVMTVRFSLFLLFFSLFFLIGRPVKSDFLFAISIRCATWVEVVVVEVSGGEGGENEGGGGKGGLR